MLINTSLLRERFVIQEKKGNQPPLVALGNRILLPLKSYNGEINERIVIRAHSMHMALRISATLTREFYNMGPILHRQVKFAWDEMWYDLITDFERPYTPETWCCIYHNGRPIFQHGEHHPFLDIIEQCDVKNRAEYDRAINITEDVFKQAGKDVDIDHQINIAVVIGAMEDKTRCGLILRAPKRTTTFNFQIENKDNTKERIPPYIGFEMSANFLEAIQLSVTSGFTDSQLDNGKILATSPKAKKTQPSYKRIGRLNQSIKSIENQYKVKYRPEKPDFTELRDEAYNLNHEVRI